jgi:hypothetical protein
VIPPHVKSVTWGVTIAARRALSEGEEELPPEADPEKQHVGRFSEGEEQLPEEDPEKHAERGFGETRRAVRAAT